MNLAFSEEEQAAINQTEMGNKDNIKLGTKDRNKTFDRIFFCRSLKCMEQRRPKSTVL